MIAVAANPESGVANVRSEEPGIVADNSRPGDISFNYNGTTIAVDVYTADPAASSNLRFDVEKLLDVVEEEKIERYLTLCTDREVVFFTFGMAAISRLSSSAEHFLRWLANCLPGTNCERDKCEEDYFSISAES